MLAYASLIYVALNLLRPSVDIYLPHGTLINYLLLILSLIGIYSCTILFLFLWFMHAAGVDDCDDGPDDAAPDNSGNNDGYYQSFNGLYNAIMALGVVGPTWTVDIAAHTSALLESAAAGVVGAHLLFVDLAVKLIMEWD